MSNQATRTPKAKIVTMHKQLDDCLALWQSTVRPWAVAAGVSEHDRDILTNALHTAVKVAADLRRVVEAGEEKG